MDHKPPNDPAHPYTVPIGAKDFAITERGWELVGWPMLLRIAWLVPDDANSTPYVLDDAAVDDLREAMERVFNSGVEVTDRAKMIDVLSYDKTGMTTSGFSRDKVWVAIDALIAAGHLAEGSRRFGLRSVILRLSAPS
ncbi:hypothetical protein GCM10028784_06460 [Myceligenerans cantabricum]